MEPRPSLDGLEVLDAVRARPAVRSLPVVVVTARDLDDEQKLRLSEHAARVLRKGNGVPLAQAIRHALRATADDSGERTE